MTTAKTTTAAVVRPLIISLFILSLQTTSLAIGEDAHLIEFKNSLKDSSPLDPTWVAGTNPCDKKAPWLGVHCSDTDYKSVSALLLMHLGLSNGINVYPLAKLESLRFLSLENNSFSGRMPEFNRLTSLKSLFLSGNQFAGEISQDFFDSMGSLKKLDLSGNNFSGRIPESLGQLDSLMEILLQQNHFYGPIPSFEQKSLQVIDLSYNNLEGEIPQTMSRFSAKSFEGNPNLCGGVIKKPCKPPPSTTSGTTTKWVILAIVVAMLLVTILFKKNDKSDKFNMIGKENSAEHNHVVQVHAPSINRRASSKRRGHHNGVNNINEGSLKKGRRRSNDLVIINEDKGMFGLPDLMKAAAEVLGNSSLGSTYKATMANGMSVVVKRMRGMNKLSKDVFETEIRRLGRIRHMNILPPLAFHFRKEEKLLVTKFIPKGNLLFLLHGMGRGELDWPTRLKIIKGVGRGMGFLHTELEVPHGNLKSSNILLSDNYEPLLTDYALYPLMSSNSEVTLKTDVYCLGVVVLEIMTGKFPSQYLNKQNSGTDVVQLVREAISEGKVAELIDPEIAAASSHSSLGEMERMVHIGATCTQDDQEARIEMREAIRSIEEVQI